MSNLTRIGQQQPEVLYRPDYEGQMQVLVMEQPRTYIYVPKNASKKLIQIRIENYLNRFRESQHNSVNRNGGR